MRKPLLLPRLGVARVDHGLVEEVRAARARIGQDEGFFVTRKGRASSAKILPADERYEQMMAAKGCRVKVGAMT